MKTLGDQVRAFREERGWNTAEMAKAAHTSRQNIESLEAHGNRIPKYLGALARRSKWIAAAVIVVTAAWGWSTRWQPVRTDSSSFYLVNRWTGEIRYVTPSGYDKVEKVP
jgi:DNA-binding XRE family transcriptional regulator